VAKVIECLQAHYEVQEVKFGKVYRWCPESAVLECSCGKRGTFPASRVSTCSKCGADHAEIVREVLDARQEEDEVDHPWRSVHPYYKPTIGA
jgi:hypothetical protein